jgi:hypothetical protein
MADITVYPRDPFDMHSVCACLSTDGKVVTYSLDFGGNAYN